MDNVVQDAPISRGRIRELRSSSQLFDVAFRIIRERRGQIAVFILVLLTVGALFAPILTPYHYAEQIRGARLEGPSWSHPFGTDHLNRDMLSRTLSGLRISLLVSLSAVAIGAPVGVAIGFLAGYSGRWIEAVLMRVIDTMLAFPGLLTAMAVLAILGTGVREIALSLGIGAVPVFARISRGQILQEKERTYVVAARSIGGSPLRIVLRHIAINTLPPILVQAALVMAFAIIAEATLNFLGMGASPPTPTIGVLLSDGRGWITSGAWWYIMFPTLALSLVLISLNFMADAVVEATNPYARWC